jgi:hypothetical protein
MIRKSGRCHHRELPMKSENLRDVVLSCVAACLIVAIAFVMAS